MARNIRQVIEEIRALLREMEELPPELGGPDKVSIFSAPGQVPIPPELDTPAFRKSWTEFIQHRAKKDPKDHWTAIAANRKLTQLARLEAPEALRWVEFALDNGLKNIQEPFQRGLSGTPTQKLARPPKKCAGCGVNLERSSYPSPKGDICPLCYARA